MEGKILELEKSSATVELAAIALGCEPDMIAKTLSFLIEEKPIIIVVSGMSKIDNSKYKAKFLAKAKMMLGNISVKKIRVDDKAAKGDKKK